MMYKYICPAIDWFEGSIPMSEYLKGKISDIDYCDGLDVKEELESLAKTINSVVDGMKSMPEDTWDDDISSGTFRVFVLPAPDISTMVPAFVWKQKNNGTTYVLSPVELGWLAEYKTE